ncbi:MAG: hypothetical protein DRH57_04235 [Candidatus Cloacimonadota bacterium]|nr:MAG: hypothetical protein DRH57_04235 [Candidatus Cloacimonadota bacterium]
MKLSILAFLWIFVIFTILLAEPPDWIVITGTQYNMVLFASAFVGNDVLADSTNMVGAFGPNHCDTLNDCRALGVWEEHPSAPGNGFWYFTIVANEDGELMHFKLYDASNDNILDANETILFQNDSTIGNPDSLFLITSSTPTDNYQSNMPHSFELKQNYPNPFNPQTVIAYQLPERAAVEISIYNILGQKVKTLVNDRKEAGYHKVIWNGKDAENRDVSSGIYFYKISTDKFSETKKCLLLK